MSYTINAVDINKDKLQRLKEICSMATIKEGLKQSGLTLNKVFTDGVDNDLAHEVAACSRDEQNELYNHMKAQVAEIMPNMFDAMSKVPTSHYAFGLTRNALLKHHEDEDDDVDNEIDNMITYCGNRVEYCGAVETPTQNKINPIATVIRTSISALKVKKGEVKASTGASKDTNAVPVNLVNVMAQAFTGPHMDSIAMQKIYNQVPKNHLYMDRIVKLGEEITKNAPSLPVTVLNKDKKPIVKKVKIVSYTKSGVQTAPVEIKDTKLIAPIDQVRQQFSINTSSISAKGAAKIAKDVYLGVPLGANKILPHVIAAYDAGIKYGDSILINTPNAILVLAFRANFGPKVWGMGNKYPMLTNEEYEFKRYDYVYFPKPLNYNTSGTNIASNVIDLRADLAKLKLKVMGKPIFFVSPIAFYHPIMMKVVCVPLTEDEIKREETMKEPKLESQPRKEEGVVYSGPVPQDAIVYPTEPEFDQAWIASCGHKMKASAAKLLYAVDKSMFMPTLDKLVQKWLMEEKNSAKALAGEVLANKNIPARVTMLSYKGHVLVGGSIKRRPFSNVLGNTFDYLRITVKNIWWNFVWSRDTYYIRKPQKPVSFNLWEMNISVDDKSYLSAIFEEIDRMDNLLVSGTLDADEVQEQERQEDDATTTADENSGDVQQSKGSWAEVAYN